MDDCQRRVRRAQQRLLETQGPEDVDQLSLQIKDKMAEVERLAEEGEVDESMALLEEVKKKKTKIEKEKKKIEKKKRKKTEKMRRTNFVYI